MFNQLTEKEDEYKKIKQYIINPIETGLWETTFNLIPQEQNSFISYMHNFFQQSQQLYNSTNIITVLSNMYNIANTAIHQSYNISDKDIDYIKSFIERYNIKMIQNHLIIDQEFIFISQTNNNYLKVLSLNKTLGDSLEKIFTELKYATLEKKEKRFSPKSILFQPYFYYTQIISDDLFSSTQEEFNYFNRAVSSYNNSSQQYLFNNNHQYEESIRMIGKAFESRLTHIYETLLRKDASHLSSIGKLLNSIENEIKNILENTIQPKKYTLLSLSKEISKKCQELEGENEQDSHEIINTFKEIANTLILENPSQPKKYTLLNISKEISKKCNILEKNNQDTQTVITEFNEIVKVIETQLQTTDNVLFPNQIQKELEKVLRFRNQVSHHNTTQSTQEDVISMLFSYIQIYLWWQEASQSIKNWDEDRKEVIKEFEKLKIDDKIIEFNSFLETKYIPKNILF